MEEGQLWPIKFHFGPIKYENGDGNIFSEMEKQIPSPEMAKKITEAPQAKENEGGTDYGSEEAAVERCSELWNEIKDAMVLEGMELTDSLLAQLQMRATILTQQIKELSPQTGSVQNVHLRFGAVLAALGELKKKKEHTNNGEWICGKEWAADVPISRSACIGQFRKWLQQQEAEMCRIRQRIPGSKNCSASLRELELEQKAQQEQIQTEGRAKHQKLCSLLGSDGQGHHQPWADKEDDNTRLCEPLEQRYLTLWLASLESLELISHFREQLKKNYPEKSFIGSELEEGPDPKRRKTLAIEENIASNKMSSEFPQQSNLAVSKLETSKLIASEEKQPQQMLIMGSDIGYSSGENNSVHEEGTTVNTNSLEENVQSKEATNSGNNTGPLWAEQIALSSELEKSFYRTVPLDEFGCTDLDTDEGGGNYLAQKFMMDELLEKGVGREGGDAGKLELTDSLIVHVDSPENRQLNDFEEIMDILDHPESNDQHQVGRSPYCFSEDDCESHSSMENGRVRHLVSRKRALAKTTTPMANFTNMKPATDLTASRRRRPQQQNVRRKWAQVRKSRSSNDGCWTGATAMWSSSNYMSSDFEWDEDFGGISSGMRGTNRKMQAGGLSEDNIGDEDDEKWPTILMARKKALCVFRDGLRQAVAESGNVNVRLRELLALVDKSIGGVDSAAYLLAEIQSTFTALFGFCQSLESRMNRIWMEKSDRKEEKENAGTSIRIGQIKDIESELILCHERMNALETTCNNLALLLGKHLSDGQCSAGNASTSSDSDYLAQFAGECNRIREELAKLRNRFGEKFVFASIQLPNGIPNKQQHQEPSIVDSDSAKKTISLMSKSTSPCTAIHANREHSFWRSYLLLCLLGFVASLGTLLYANSQESTDWRWSFGPQLHYENGPPPI